jgi:PAS domain S-box-containing protein
MSNIGLYLAGDRFIRGGIVVFAVIATALLWPGAEAWSAGRWLREFWELPALLLTLLALRRPPKGAGSAREPSLERRFWNTLSIAVCLWIAFALFRLVFAGRLPTIRFHMIEDVLIVGLLFVFLLSTEVRPDLGPLRLRWPMGRRVEDAGTVLFGISLFFYFVWIPAQVDSAAYLSRLPTATLILSLNAYVTMRFLYQALNAAQRRWRILFGGMTIAAGSAVVAVVVVLVSHRGAIQQEEAAPLESLFYLTLVGVLVMARLRKFPFSERATAVTVGRSGAVHPTRFTGRLMVYAMLLPGVHFALGSLRMGSTLAQDPQEVLLLIHIGLLGFLAIVQHRSLAQNNAQLESESRQAEEKLRLLTKAFETMRLGVAVKDLEGHILYLNPAQARMHGYSVEELLGKRAADLGPPEIQQPSMLRSPGEIEFRQADSVNVRRDGTRFPVHLISDLVRDADGVPVAVVTSCEDISERKAMEEALRRSEGDYRGLFENAHDAILILRPDEIVLDVNPSASRLYGLSREAFVGISLEGVSVHPVRGKEHLRAAVEKGDVYEFETEQYRSDGTIMTLEVRAAFIQYRGEQALLSINRDITERKRAETALKAANEELKTFLSLISHDLRAPLVNLKGFASELAEALEVIAFTVRERMPGLTAPERQKLEQALHDDAPEAMEFIEAAVAQMGYFIDALLGLSRAGRREVEIETLEVSSLVREVVDTFSYQVQRTGAMIEVGDLPTVKADRFCLTQIFSNLVSNALAYQQPGRPARVIVSAEAREGEVLFEVRDNGRGIHEEDREKVFQPFRRAGKQDVPGEGMGLAYVQALVRRLGGRLTLESTVGVGSTFSFSVPSRPDEEIIEAATA